ncbi:MAG: hypothetical protein CL610_12755 [Anaerolineaceae bacterium]|nr:hypothetical protein [Anaerolineaceae bacterium]
MRYSEEQRQAALDRLAANNGDYPQTSTETGVPVATLRRWAHGKKPAPPASRGDGLAQLRTQLAAYKQAIRDRPEPDNLLERASTHLLLSMIEDAIRLSESIEEVIDEAPLNQRATALNQMIDKIIKLSKELPQTGEQVIRIEFIDPDGTTHETPYWSRDHSQN